MDQSFKILLQSNLLFLLEALKDEINFESHTFYTPGVVFLKPTKMELSAMIPTFLWWFD